MTAGGNGPLSLPGRGYPWPEPHDQLITPSRRDFVFVPTASVAAIGGAFAARPLIGTHLGRVTAADLGEHDGYFCPCHGSVDSDDHQNGGMRRFSGDGPRRTRSAVSKTRRVG